MPIPIFPTNHVTYFNYQEKTTITYWWKLSWIEFSKLTCELGEKKIYI